MDGLKKQILLDCFVTPATVIPTLVGGTLLLLSQMLGPLAAFVGFALGLVGLGMVASNMIFNLDKIQRRAAQRWHDAQKRARDAELDSLDRRLTKTPYKDDELALRNLRALYDTFSKDFAGGKISRHVPQSMLGQIDEIFEKCVLQLAKSYELFEQGSRVNGALKKQFTAQRKQMVEEVEASVEHLGIVIGEVRALKLKCSRNELQDLKRKLESQLDVARSVDERMFKLEQGDIPVEERLGEYTE